MSNKFANKFNEQLIAEAEGIPDVNPGDVEPAEGEVSDAQAFEQGLEPNTNPKDFDTQPAPVGSLSAAGIERAKEWVGRIEDFNEFINGVEPGSINHQINELDRDGSVFQGVVRSQQKRIVGVAEDLSSLVEVLKGYIIGADKKMRDLEKQQIF